MLKSRVKVREIKKKIKITEIKKLEPSLEEKVNLDILPSQASPINTANPTIAQRFIPQFSQETKSQVREGIQGKDREFSYLSDPGASRRSYDPSIKSSRQFMESQVSAGRINPTIQQTPFQNQQQALSRNIRDNLNQGDIEPGLRRFKDDERNYKSEKAESYVARRRTE